jgi:hypothetical protein
MTGISHRLATGVVLRIAEFKMYLALLNLIT